MSKSSESAYIPISEIPSLEDADPEHDTLTWNFSFPQSVDTERLVVNMRALGWVQSLAAFGSSHVFCYQGDRTTFTTPTIVGINLDGTAIAGRTGKTQHADTSKQAVKDIKGLPPSLKADYFQSSSLHTLNKAELASQVVDKCRSTRRDTPAEKEWANAKAWAEVVDAALSTSLRDAAKQNLVNRVSRPVQAISALILGMNGGVAFGDAVMQNYGGIIGDVGLPLAVCWGLSVGTSVLANKARFGDALLSERKWSIMPLGGWQPDRYIAAAALTRTVMLVSARQ